jgi:hypothetical protein
MRRMLDLSFERLRLTGVHLHGSKGVAVVAREGRFCFKLLPFFVFLSTTTLDQVARNSVH